MKATNTLAYYAIKLITFVKSLIGQAPGVYVNNYFPSHWCPVACTINILQLQIKIGSDDHDATIWSITLESSIALPESSFTLL